MAAHTFLNPDGMSPPVGFSHVAVAAPGRLVFVAGQTAHQADGTEHPSRGLHATSRPPNTAFSGEACSIRNKWRRQCNDAARECAGSMPRGDSGMAASAASIAKDARYFIAANTR